MLVCVIVIVYWAEGMSDKGSIFNVYQCADMPIADTSLVAIDIVHDVTIAHD